MEADTKPVIPLDLYVTEREIAESLKLSTSQMANLRKRRLIPFLQIGRSVRYLPAAVNAALAKLTVAAA